MLVTDHHNWSQIKRGLHSEAVKNRTMSKLPPSLEIVPVPLQPAYLRSNPFFNPSSHCILSSKYFPPSLVHYHHVFTPSCLHCVRCPDPNWFVPGVSEPHISSLNSRTDVSSSLSSLSATQLGSIAIKGEFLLRGY
jgi:hypothetical protein